MITNIADETLTREARMLKETFTRGEAVSVSNIDEAARTVQLSFASEHPVERWFGIESLEMTSRAAELKRLNRGGALLSDHNTRQQIGKVVKAWIGDDKRAHAIVKFSRKAAAEEEFQDVIDGIRENVSFGYKILEYRTEKGKGNTPDTVTATRWEAMEISLVAVPADPTVGVGRAEEGLGLPEKTDEQIQAEEVRDEAENTAENIEERGSKIIMVNNESGQPVLTREDEILEFGKKFGVDEKVARHFALDSNKNLADFQSYLREQYKDAVTVQATPEKPASEIGMTEREVTQYSLARAILAQADNDWSKAGFERECHAAIVANLGRESEGGFFVPSEVQNIRDLSATGGGTSGGYLVGTDHMPQSFIELLRSKAIMLSKAGVTVMSGLVGNPSIPRQDDKATGYWVAEGVAPAESQLVLGQLGMSPKTCGALTEFTRQLLVQSAPSIDQLVKSDIAAVLARTIDSAIIQGTGTNGQPTGILSTTGVSELSMAGASFAWEDAVNFETQIAEGNAPDATRWVCKPSVKGTLKTRPKIGSTYPVYLLEGNKLNGYEVDSTTQMPASTLIFGDFSTVILGEWGILEIEANKYGSSFGHGGIQVRGLHMVDVAVRYPQALKKLTAFA
jgi:HK97 family phage major capsid protein